MSVSFNTLGTVRRFLEHYSKDFDFVLFCVDNAFDMHIYMDLLSVYFPRNYGEVIRAQEKIVSDIGIILCFPTSVDVLNLLISVGNEFGEPVIEERKIRISTFSPFTNDNNQHDHSPTEG